ACSHTEVERSHVDSKTVSKLIGDRQCRFKNRSKPLTGRHNDDSLVLSKGTKGEWTPHDLRRTGATMMQELGVTLEIIDRCQNHLLGGSKVRRHYLHHDYAKEKTQAWTPLASRF
ncbi:integrase, partial [Pseudomonas aeruginosa]